MLDMVASYHCTQFQGKLMNQTLENGKKHSFGTNFGAFGPKNIFLEFYLYYMLNINVLGPILAHLALQFFFKTLALSVTRYMVSYDHVQYQKKLMIQS